MMTTIIVFTQIADLKIFTQKKKIQYYLRESELTDYEEGINEMYRESDTDFNQIIILEYTEILHSTEYAWKLGRMDKINGNTEFWIPKSVCKIKEEDKLIAIPIWVINFE